ncbi:MAG: DUF11 domain-containing protein [Steroidobacteraceae bacterium]
MNTLIRRQHRALLPVLAASLGLVPRLIVAAPDIALQMSVDTVVPTPWQPVEFTVTATNVGTSAATGLQVTDQLPPALVIPAGMAAFPSTGTYDPVAGVWSVGELPVGASATLVIPAVVAASPVPACNVNVAQSRLAADTNAANDRALAAVKGSAAYRCVDLAVVRSTWNTSGCDSWYTLDYDVTVTNYGPDEAANVFVDMSQTPHLLPHFTFRADACTDYRCTIATLGAGESRTFTAKSDPIDFSEKKNVDVDFAVSSDDTDYDTDNNVRHDNTTVPRTPSCYYGNGDSYIGVGGCFIATAAYGSSLEPHVVALREFRDRYLRRSELGRAFIRFYYRHSPPIAAFIARHDAMRFVVRTLITPLVLVIEYPWPAGALATVALGLLARWRRRSATPAKPGGP